MIFLAVVLGFFAENIRENFGQRAKEKELVIALIKDFETGIALFHSSLPIGKERLSGLDSLINETYWFIDGKGDTRKMYYYYHHYLRNQYTLNIAFQTVDMLQSSADVDIIQNNKVNVLIKKLAYTKENIKSRDELEERLRQNASDFGLNIFDYRVYKQAVVDSTGYINGGGLSEMGFLTLPNQPTLINKDPALLKKFAGLVGLYRNYQDLDVNNYHNGIFFFEKEIKLIADEYGIDNETMQRIHEEVIEGSK